MKFKLFLLILSVLIISCSSNSTEQQIDNKSDCQIFKTILQLGDYYEFALKAELNGDYQSALKYYKLSYEYGGTWDDSTIQIYSISSISRIQIYMTLYEEALNTIEETRKLNEKINNFEIATMCLENYGLICYYREDYSNAEKNFLEALKNYTKCEVFSSMANLCNNIALVYIKTGNYKEAEEYLKKAAKINIQLNRYYDQSVNLSNLGLLYKLQGKFEEAEKAYLLALEINKKYKIPIGKNLFNLAELYYENDKTELAIDYYSKVVIFVKSLPKASKKDLYMAVDSCNKIIIIAQKIGDNILEEDYKNKKKWFIEELRKLGENIPDD